MEESKKSLNLLHSIRLKWNTIRAAHPLAFYAVVSVIGVVVLFGITNAAIGVYYQNRAYPNTYVGSLAISGQTYDGINNLLADHVQQPARLEINGQQIEIPTSEFNSIYDIEGTLQKIRQISRPKFPLLAMLSGGPRSTVHFVVDFDDSKIDTKAADLSEKYSRPPVDADIEIVDGQVKVTEQQTGRQYDQSSVANQIKTILATLPTQPASIEGQDIPVSFTTNQARDLAIEIERKLSVAITITHQQQEYTFSREEIAQMLHITESHQIHISQDAVLQRIKSIADKIDQPVTNRIIAIRNGEEIVHQEGKPGQALDQEAHAQAIIEALNSNMSYNQMAQVNIVEPATIRPVIYNYCVTANQVDPAELTHFSQKITATLADAKGWGLQGRILFQKVDSGCSFNLVLAAAHTLPHYSSGCSVIWSCRVGSNVIINIDRWKGASDSWNQAGGSLDDYQSMVINHEVGHWLGFDHWSCGGPGQPAPVMLQQSINLYGCAFNPWPTSAELNQLRAVKGLS